MTHTMTMHFSLVLSATLFGTSLGLSAFYSYEDATCIDSNTIKGTAVMSYDDSDYAAYGYSMSYYGGCMYFSGGSLDLEDYDYGYGFYEYGYCVECDGAVGCSSDGSCDNFMTYPGTTASSGYQQMVSGSSNYSDEQTTLPFGQAASQIKSASLEAEEHKVEQEDTNGEASMNVAVSGGLVGMALMSLIVAVIYWTKKRKSTPKIQLDEVEATGAGHNTGEYFLSKDDTVNDATVV